MTRNVRVIPILIDGARMPRADELPQSLVSLRRRQALELSPSRFEYDTGRLLKVLDAALAEARTPQDDAPTKPVPRPPDEPTSAHGNIRTGDEGGPAKNVDASGRSRTRRRLLMIGVPLVAVLALYFVVQLVGDQTTPPQNNSAHSSATDEITEEAPWRLVIRNDGSGAGCTITLINNDTSEPWSNPYPVYETASFLFPQGGTFQWSVESGCTVLSRQGPGSLTLPAVVDGVGTSDAFKPPAAIRVSVKDFHGNQRCALELRDVATGTTVDIGELNDQLDSVTLQPHGRPLVYLINDTCAVEVSPG